MSKSQDRIQKAVDEASRKAEISVRKEMAAEKLEKITGLVFCAASLSDLEFDPEDEEDFIDSDDNLSQKHEKLRKEIQTKLNDELRNKFGFCDDTIVYLVSDKTMQEMGYHW